MTKKVDKTKGKKMNRKMSAKATYRSEVRFAGALKILDLVAKGAPVVSGPVGVLRLQQMYGV